MKRLISLLLCVVLACSCMGVAAARQEYTIPAVVVNCNEYVSLRAQPSTSAARLAKVPKGAYVQLVSNAAYRGDGKYFVQSVYNGQLGYIAIEYLDAIMEYGNPLLQLSAEPSAYGGVSTTDPGDDVIMRSGPGTSYDNLGLLFGGEVASYLGEQRADTKGTVWYRCRHLGLECWISSQYTTLRLQTPVFETAVPTQMPFVTLPPFNMPELEVTYPLSFYVHGFAWSTEIHIGEQNTFSGFYYHREDRCDFTGVFTNVEQLDQYTMRMTVGELSYSADSNCTALGIEQGDTCYLYIEGTPKYLMPRDAAYFHKSYGDWDNLPDYLEFCALYNADSGYCFAEFEPEG